MIECDGKLLNQELFSRKLKPFTPDEAIKAKVVPDVVIEAFNEILAREFDGSSAKILQKDAISLIKKKGIDSDQLFKNKWLDIEEIYKSYGWKVYYDKPAYNESYYGFLGVQEE